MFTLMEKKNNSSPKRDGCCFRTFLGLVFPASPFCGRVQVGCRGKGKTMILPALTCDYDILGSMLDVFEFSPFADYYLTGNSFSGIKRRANDLFSFHNLVLDLDCHQKFSWDEIDFQIDFIWQSLTLFMGKYSLPLPTVKVNTGRGLQLWWTLEGISGKFQPSYSFALHILIDFLNLFLRQHEISFVQKFWFVDEGASRNLVGYFRLPLTFNSKVNRLVTYEQYGEVYPLLSLCERLSDSVKLRDLFLEDTFRTVEVPLSFTGDFSDSSPTKREFHQDAKRDETFVRKRILFLEQLRQWRDGAVGAEERNNFCFMIYNTYVTVYGHALAMQRLCDFNQKFKVPLTVHELENVIVTAKKKGGYYYSNVSMFSFLHVTEEERKMFYPVAGEGTLKQQKSLEVADRKEKRNLRIFELYQEGKTMAEVAQTLGIVEKTVSLVLSKEKVKHSAQRREEILALFAKGKKVVEIVKICHCSRRTVERVLASVREQDE